MNTVGNRTVHQRYAGDGAVDQRGRRRRRGCQKLGYDRGSGIGISVMGAVSIDRGLVGDCAVDCRPQYGGIAGRFCRIFAGYAAYYLVRNNLALAIPDILAAHPEYSKADLGWALTGSSIAYGVSKFLMGSVSDRSNPKYFLPLGLLLSCALMAVSGVFKAIYAWLALVIVIQIANGWVQGMGWPPCGKTMVHWFSTKERGLVVSVWNVAHNVGGGLVASFALFGVTLFGDWGAKFYFNAVIAAAVAVAVFFLCATRRSRSACHCREYKNDYRRTTTPRATHLHVSEIFVEHVLNNATSGRSRSRTRSSISCAMASRTDSDLSQTAKGFSFKQSSIGWALYEYAAIPGTIACGWMSDTVFKGRRAPATILFMGLTLVAVVVYGLNRSGPLWIDYAALIAIGFLIYGPIMIIGLHALDLVPKKAAGTAAGFTGFSATCSARPSPAPVSAGSRIAGAGTACS
jgi:OPA family glycerol-3-phosphate transporter-like MFS transporter